MRSLPPVKLHHPHVEVITTTYSGSPVITGTKVPVRRLWAWHRKGVTCETLVKRYPTLGPAKILSGLAFCYDNQELIEADLERERCLMDDDSRVPGDMEQLVLKENGR